MKQSQDYIQLHIPENPSTEVLIKKKLLFSSHKERCKGKSPRQFHDDILVPGSSFFLLSHPHTQISSTFFFNFNFYLFIYLFIYFWLCWVFVSVRGLSLVAARGHSSSRCTGLSLSRPLLLRSTGSRHAGSVVVAHGPSCSAACEIFPDQGSNPCPLHWQADSQPLCHQGSPSSTF